MPFQTAPLIKRSWWLFKWRTGAQTRAGMLFVRAMAGVDVKGENSVSQTRILNTVCCILHFNSATRSVLANFPATRTHIQLVKSMTLSDLLLSKMRAVRFAKAIAVPHWENLLLCFRAERRITYCSFFLCRWSPLTKLIFAVRFFGHSRSACFVFNSI